MLDLFNKKKIFLKDHWQGRPVNKCLIFGVPGVIFADVKGWKQFGSLDRVEN